MESMRVEERPMSLLEKRAFIRQYNKAHPVSKPWSHRKAWGVFLLVWAVIVVVAVYA